MLDSTKGVLVIDPSSTDRSLPGIRLLDAAKGIIVALRGCTLSEAFIEIVNLAEDYDIGPLAISKALVELAEGQPQHHPTAAQKATSKTWASLLARPGHSTAG